MFKYLKILFSALKDRLYCYRDPIGFARSIGVRLGANVKFYGVSRAMFGSEPWLVSIGNNCYITAGVQFVTHDGGTLILRQHEPTLEWTAPIRIGDDVYIGVRSIILPNVKIGNNCIVGAGSVVSKDVPDNCVFAGVPARFICTTNDYFEKMKKKSLGCGNLSAIEKAEVIRDFYQRKGWFD